MRFALTSEAGLNDGLAFPFVHLAIALASTSAFSVWQFSEWLAVDVAWKILVGIVFGGLIGRGLGWLMFHLPNPARLSRTEPRRVSRRLLILRGWSHDEANPTLFP